VIKTDVATDDEVNVDVSMPLILKGGVLVRPTPKVEIEAAAVWEGWSVIDEVVVTNVDMSIETSLGDVVISDDVVLPAGYQDTLSLRLGGEVDAHKRFTLRAGGLWEASAIPAETQAVSLLDGKKLGYGLGGTVHATRSLDVDLGWFQSFIPERTITDSQVHQIWANVAPNAETGEFDATLQDGTVVGNGTLSAGVMVFGAGLNWSFGKGKDEG
jgi:long-subunit fatty acid transport protein